MIVLFDDEESGLYCGEDECAGEAVTDVWRHAVEVHDDTDVEIVPAPRVDPNPPTG